MPDTLLTDSRACYSAFIHEWLGLTGRAPTKVRLSAWLKRVLLENGWDFKAGSWVYEVDEKIGKLQAVLEPSGKVIDLERPSPHILGGK